MESGLNIVVVVSLRLKAAGNTVVEGVWISIQMVLRLFAVDATRKGGWVVDAGEQQ